MARAATTLTEMQKQIDALAAKVARQDRVQRASLRALTFLPQELGQLLEETIVDNAVLTPDGEGMTHKLGETLVVTVYPFRQTLVIADPTSKVQPLDVKFGEGHPVDDAVVRQILGQKALVLRPAAPVNPNAFYAKGLSELVGADA